MVPELARRLADLWKLDNPTQSDEIDRLVADMAPLVSSGEELVGLIDEAVEVSQIKLSDETYYLMLDAVEGTSP